MSKLVVLLSLSAFFIIGCSSSIDLSDLTPEERLQNAIQLYEDEDSEDAVREFEAILLQYPGSSIIDDAQYYLGLTRFQRSEYIIAAYEFSKLIKNIPASPFVPDAQFMLAECYFELSPDFNLDQSYTKKAIEEFQAFIDFFPLNEKVHDAELKINELNEKLAKKDLSIANIYEKLSYYTASLKYYEYVVETYHDTEFAPRALFSKIKLLIDRDREDEALSDIKKFLLLYPEDENADEVKTLRESIEGNISFN